MPTTLLLIFLLYNLVNSIIAYLFPENLRLGFFNFFALHHHPKTKSTLVHKETSPSPSPPPPPSPAPPPSTVSSSESSFKSTKRMDPVELKRLFQAFDRNGDGRITKEELNHSLGNLGIFIPDMELTQMIEKIDVNGDGCVDVDEFRELYQQLMDVQDADDDMMEAFNVFDQNGDGYITVDELRTVLATLGLKQGRALDLEDCKTMIMRVDVDGDGMVNFKEFKQMMKRGGLSVQS